jgi:hypothetical protein
MKDLNRDQLARHLFDVMHKGQWTIHLGHVDLAVATRRVDPVAAANSYWDFLVEHGWHKGYLRLADEIISKGYKP